MALFNNIQPHHLNSFLVSPRHDGTCFCLICREDKLHAIGHNYAVTLQDIICNQLPVNRENQIIVVHDVTKEQIVYGKRYKNVCLAGTHYSLLITHYLRVEFFQLSPIFSRSFSLFFRRKFLCEIF